MKLKDQIKSGTFITAVPIGLQVTLQYNVAGNLYKVFLGFDQHEDITATVMTKLVDEKTVPQPIRIHGGSTFVHGVLYTHEITRCDGALPECCQSELLRLYIEDSAKFSFYACNIRSEAYAINGGKPVRDNLLLSGFKILPSMLAPAVLTDEFITVWADTNMRSFHTKVITDFCVQGSDCSYVNTGAYQVLATKTSKYTDDYGFEKVDLGSRTIDYSDFITHGVQHDAVLVFDHSGRIATCVYGTQGVRNYSNICPVCGKTYMFNTSGKVQCDGVGCLSRSLAAVQNMLSRLGLPELQYTGNYIEWVKSNGFVNIVDVLDCDQYAGIEIHTTLATLIRSIVPVADVRSDDLFTLLANGCNNTIKTLEYYLEHPDRIRIDLGINHAELPSFAMWISIPSNHSDLAAMLSHPRVHIDGRARRFDGAPILRNTTIFITGSFIHGSLTDVAAIFQSYAADVVTAFDSRVNAVVVGGNNDGTDGQAVMSARSIGIPVYGEIEFFQHFDIDTDIQLAQGV